MSFSPLLVMSRGQFPESVTPNRKMQQTRLDAKRAPVVTVWNPRKRKQDLNRNGCSGSLRKEHGGSGVKTMCLLM